MSINVEVTATVNRRVADAFRIFATNHVQNHPRWDSDISLEQISDGPVGPGTKIKRINTRSGSPIEGTMEVVEYEFNKKFGMYTKEGSTEFRGLTLFEEIDSDHTILTHKIEFFGMDEVTDEKSMTALVQGAIQNHKGFIESET